MIRSHIHHAADRMLDGIHYLNCGDWVESAKTSVETHSGKQTPGSPGLRPCRVSKALLFRRPAFGLTLGRSQRCELMSKMISRTNAICYPALL
jgi:hypothetical protein